MNPIAAQNMPLYIMPKVCKGRLGALGAMHFIARDILIAELAPKMNYGH